MTWWENVGIGMMAIGGVVLLYVGLLKLVRPFIAGKADQSNRGWHRIGG